MSLEFLDPTHETAAADFALAGRLPALKGMTVGIISNGKFGTAPFFDAFENELVESYGVAKVVRRTKSNYSAPADPHIMDEAQEWNALVAGIGD
ncbi:MAG: hypothetical protein CMM76_12220 [Rhodospirillaceae bacterium]|nr:hypothetical protein [Rhodospirillaceae bacterium]|tara:strand:+ start:48 stop:329 length:282 start_codon:yes stop_codon:yes gene_type:complete